MTDARLKDANKAAARLRVVRERGDLYVAQTADGTRIKIGFSTQLADRIKALNYDFPSAGPFVLLGSVNSTHRVEQQLHRALRPFHQIHINAGKELYPACPGIQMVVEDLLSLESLEPLDIEHLRGFRAWCRWQASLDANRAAARTVHAERFAKAEAAHAAWMDMLSRRIAARSAA